MTDIEKVVEGLKHCNFGNCGPCYENDCPYYQSHDCTDELKNDILSLLKESSDIVRCKDCKHYMTIHCTCDGCCISDDWFCADGERADIG